MLVTLFVAVTLSAADVEQHAAAGVAAAADPAVTLQDVRRAEDQLSGGQQSDTQTPDEQQAGQKKPPTPLRTGLRALFGNIVEDVRRLPARPNLYLAAIGGGLATATHPADQTLNVRLGSHDDAVNTTCAAGK